MIVAELKERERERDRRSEKKNITKTTARTHILSTSSNERVIHLILCCLSIGSVNGTNTRTLGEREIVQCVQSHSHPLYLSTHPYKNHSRVTHETSNFIIHIP